ncbi:4Fe-4S binding protein, partial [bacterium]|nr:4Fe-4S binding protein [bacterium]
MPIEIILNKCTGCRKCIPVCPFSAVEVVDKKAKILDNCTLCGACVDACRFDAIVLDKEEKKISTGEYKGILVFAEQRHDELQTVTLELLNEARKLADILKEELSVVL